MVTILLVCVVVLFLGLISLFSKVMYLENLLIDSITTLRNEHELDIQLIKSEKELTDRSIESLTKLSEVSKKEEDILRENFNSLNDNFNEHLKNHIDSISKDVILSANDVKLPNIEDIFDMSGEVEEQPKRRVVKWDSKKKEEVLNILREHKSEHSFREWEKLLGVPNSTLKRWYKEIY